MLTILLTRSESENLAIVQQLGGCDLRHAKYHSYSEHCNRHPEQHYCHPELVSGSEILKQVQHDDTCSDKTHKICEYCHDSMFNYLLLPLIKYHDLAIDYCSIFFNYKNFILASKHAAQLIDNALRSMNITHEMSFWVVGQSSAEILNFHPMVKIKYIAHNITNLVCNLPTTIYDSSIYLSADQITVDLPKSISRQIIYQTKYKTVLQSNTVAALRAGVDYILLYSQNCAKILIAILSKYDLLDILRRTIVIVISNKVGNIIAPYCDNIYCAESAQQDKILEILINHATARK